MEIVEFMTIILFVGIFQTHQQRLALFDQCLNDGWGVGCFLGAAIQAIGFAAIGLDLFVDLLERMQKDIFVPAVFFIVWCDEKIINLSEYIACYLCICMSTIIGEL